MKALNAFVAAIIFFFSLPLIGQNQSASAPSACGDLQVTMTVTLDRSRHAVAQPEPGKALIYFINDTGLLEGTLGYAVIRIGIDGRWVGANKGSSYFSVLVDPGEHHLCAGDQAGVFKERPVLAHFTAEPGKVYFYWTRMLDYNLDLGPVDSDEAAYRIGQFQLATAQAKK